MPAYEVEVMVSVNVDGDENTAYRVVDSLLDHVLTPRLPEGIAWSMVEGCVTDVTEVVRKRDQVLNAEPHTHHWLDVVWQAEPGGHGMTMVSCPCGEVGWR